MLTSMRRWEQHKVFNILVGFKMNYDKRIVIEISIDGVLYINPAFHALLAPTKKTYEQDNKSQF